jgi:hypothetical protein
LGQSPIALAGLEMGKKGAKAFFYQAVKEGLAAGDCLRCPK